MFQCPRCTSLSVTEERLIPSPSGQMKGWMHILLWPFRMPGMFIITVAVVLFAVWFMAYLGNAIEQVHPGSEVGGGIAGCLATIFLGLYALVMSRLSGIITSKVVPTLAPAGQWLVRIPPRYYRTCQNCGYTWIWDPQKSSKPEASFPARLTPDTEQRTRQDLSAVQDNRPPTKVHFRCPNCSHESNFDPWVGPAQCPECGYAADIGKQIRRVMKRNRLDTSEPYLQDFLNHWYGKPSNGSPFDLASVETKVASFDAYRESLGEDLRPTPGRYYSSGFFRRHTPSREDVLSFLDAYHLIQTGEKDHAHDKLSTLTQRSPEFIEAWLWQALTETDPIDRNFCLEMPYQKDPFHPLVVDIYSIIRGGVSYPHVQSDIDGPALVEAQHCPSCGGKLHYEAGTSEVECSYCGHQIILRPFQEYERRSHTVSSLRLQRKILGQSWRTIDRILSCQACGSQLTMTGTLAKSCAFCGSPNVIVEDHKTALEQPDGFIPFQIDEQSAKKAVRRHQPSPLWDFRGWRTFNSLKYKHLKGIYMPFWVFDGVVEPLWAEVHRDGSHTKMSGPGAPFSAEGLIFSGTNRPAPSHLDKVSKYDIGSLVDFEPQLLADWPAMLYNIDVEIAAEDAYDVMITLAQVEMGPPILPMTSMQESSRAVRTLQVSSTTYRLILLPLWIAHLTSPSAIALALVNGQTGASTFSMVTVK